MRLIIGFDDTAYGRDALELGLRLAASTGDTPVVATVYPDDEATADSTESRTVAERKLDAARVLVGDRLTVRFEAIGPTYASFGLYEYAEHTSADLLVVGSSEHAPIGAVAPNSTVERLLNGAPCPIAVAPRGYHERSTAIRDIAVAYDGSPESQGAVSVAAQVAHRIDASLRLVAVAPEPDEALRAVLDAAGRELPADLKVTTDVVIAPGVADTLADLPAPRPDLLVCGSRGVGPRRRVLLGSTSTRLVRSAAYPIIIVPHTLC
jgi:nucleotide-binding universal stress UspA family protein